MKNQKSPEDEYFQIPSSDSVKKSVDDYEPMDRSYVETVENFADKEETVKKFLNLAQRNLQRYVAQASRVELIRYMKDADAKFRIARRQAQQFRDDSSQEQNTLSHVASTQFYKSCKLIWTGLCNIIFGQGDMLPARYEPILDSGDYTSGEGQRVAEEQTMYFKWCYDKENWEQWIKNSLMWVIKNAHEIISVQWDYKTDTKRERVPGFYTSKKEPKEVHLEDGIAIVTETGVPYAGDGYDVNGNPVVELYDQNGKPASFVFIDKTRIVKNNPVLIRYRMEDSYFDLDIADDGSNPDTDVIQLQSCVLFNNQDALDSIISKQQDGMYMNVDKLGTDQLYQYSTQTDNDIKSEKDDNADTPADNDRNGLYDKWHIWLRAPINKKGEWIEGGVPEWHEAVFYGKVNSEPSAVQTSSDDGKTTGPVCTMLRKNPYYHKRLPYKLVFSHLDDRGAVHMGYYSLLECNIEEQTVTVNQHIDNKTLKIKSPFVGERGNVLSRNLVFRNGNQVIWVKPGTASTALTQLKIDDMTNSTLPLLDFLRKDADEAVGTTDVIQGQYAGSRTTGTEVVSVREQALQPAIEHAKYMAHQIFGFILRDVADNCRQFADPNKTITMYDESGNSIVTFKPTELYGQLKTKIVSIDHFKADIMAQQTLINFIQSGGYDRALPYMGKMGALHFWRVVAKFLKIPDIFKIFPAAKKQVEAENQAWLDVEIIMNDPMRAMQDETIMPKPEEEHGVHLSILKSQRDKLSILIPTMPEGPQKEQADLSLRAFDLYILMHEQFEEQTQAEEKQFLTSPMNQSSETPSMEGEAVGDMLSGMQGQQLSGAQ